MQHLGLLGVRNLPSQIVQHNCLRRSLEMLLWKGAICAAKGKSVLSPRSAVTSPTTKVSFCPCDCNQIEGKTTRNVDGNVSHLPGIEIC